MLTTSEDSVSAMQEWLKKLQKFRANTQKVLQKCIKPITSPYTFVSENKVWANTVYVIWKSKHLLKSSALKDMNHLRCCNRFFQLQTTSNSLNHSRFIICFISIFWFLIIKLKLMALHTFSYSLSWLTVTKNIKLKRSLLIALINTKSSI